MTADSEALSGLRALLRPVVTQLVEDVLAQRDGGTRPAAEGFIGVAEAARRTGCAPDTIRSWISRGTLPATRPVGSKNWRIKPGDLEAVLAGAERAGSEPVHLAERRAARARALAEAVKRGGGGGGEGRGA